MHYSYTRADGELVLIKMVYDSNVCGNATMTRYVRNVVGMAGWYNYQANPSNSNPIVAVNGVKFQVYINTDLNGNKYVGNVHPIK